MLGAVEVGMLRALLEAGITPDLIVGTSIGALNGALLATEPSVGVIERLESLWRAAADSREIYGEGPVAQVRRAVRSRTHVYSAQPLRDRLGAELGGAHFEHLAVPFQCVASSIERAAEHWFSTGPVAPAVMASAAVPGFFPPAEIDGEHFLDGGLVNSIPLDRARKLGAQRVFVLQVGRIEQPLKAPVRPWDVPIVALEVTRRARFHASLERAHELDMEVHVLPTGGLGPKPTDRANFDPFDTSRVEERMAGARAASADYLSSHGLDLTASVAANSPGRNPPERDPSGPNPPDVDSAPDRSPAGPELAEDDGGVSP